MVYMGYTVGDIYMTFFKKLNYNIIKIAKTMRIFMEMERIKSCGVVL